MQLCPREYKSTEKIGTRSVGCINVNVLGVTLHYIQFLQDLSTEGNYKKGTQDLVVFLTTPSEPIIMSKYIF